MVEELPQFKPRKIWMEVRYPPQMAKSILKQTSQGLVFLHGNGIAHGDLQPGNMLFALKGIDAEAEDVLRQKEDVDGNSISPPVERLDGKQDLWAPPYLCIAQPLVSLTPFLDDFTIKLSDMGGGKFSCFSRL
jgi:non-specific serine/threonine protein kinase